MQNIHFDGNKIIITKEIRKIISDLQNENDFSDSKTDEYIENELPIKRSYFSKKYR